MTTVSFDGKRLVSDSQATVGTRRRLGPAKKIHVAGKDDNWTLLGKKVLAFGFAGNGGALNWITQSLTKGVGAEQPVTAKEISFSVIAVTDTGDAFYWNVSKHLKNAEDRHEVTPVTGPIAIGSGAVIAETVLALGKSAKKAVKAAMQQDIHTGGALQVYRVPVKGVKRLRV